MTTNAATTPTATTTTTKATTTTTKATTTKASSTLRIITAAVAALVPVANAAFGWHLTVPDIAAVVTPLLVLIGAEAHVQAYSQPSASSSIGELISFLDNALKVYMDTTKGGGSGGGAG